MEKIETRTIVILDDGETYSAAHHCTLCIITDAEAADLDCGKITCGDLNPITEIRLGVKDYNPR